MNWQGRTTGREERQNIAEEKVDERPREDVRVEPIEHPAVAREEAAVVLLASWGVGSWVVQGLQYKGDAGSVQGRI